LKQKKCKTRCHHNRNKPVPNNEHKSVAVDLILKTVEHSVAGGKTARRTVMACVPAQRIRALIPERGTMDLKCQAFIRGLGEFQSRKHAINFNHQEPETSDFHVAA
jgi:hypothetical protein